MSIYTHVPHPRIHQRRLEKPPQTDDERVGLNGRIGAVITKGVGTMICAYVFAVLAVLGFPGLSVSLTSIHYSSEGISTLQYVQWISQTFIQLVMLSIIMVGQNVLGGASDKRAVQTYQDAEAILHECLQLQEHLQAQDQVLKRLLDTVASQTPSPRPAGAS